MNTSTDSSVRFVDVNAEDAGQRLDNWLLARLRGVPRSRIYRIVRKGEVRVNGGRCRPEQRLAAGDTVRIPPVRVAADPTVATAAPWLSGRILLEHEDLLVLDKPEGLAVHGGSGIEHGLIESLRATRPQDPQLELVHRLDRDTSGCLLVARRRSALRRWHARFRDHQVEKVYLALVTGRWPRRRTRCDVPLTKYLTPSGERRTRADLDGAPSTTEIRVLEYLEGATLVEARPRSGRTHQIRVHLAHGGHPIIGDTKYADPNVLTADRGRGLDRLFLHASRLRWTGDPDHGDAATDLDVGAPLPAAFEAAIVQLRGAPGD